MKTITVIAAIILITACANTEEKSTPPASKVTSMEIEDIKKDAPSDGAISLSSDFLKFNPTEIELDPINDSIWYHLTYDLGKNGILAVAQPSNESYEGVRLQTLSKNNTGELTLINESSPGYDSSMLFPTFFKNDKNQIIILANTGAIDSWGLKVYSLIDQKFEDIGFIDMAVIEKREFPDENGKMLRYGNIGPYMEIRTTKKGLVFQPSKEKLILFENNRKQRDIEFDKDQYIYILDTKKFKLKKN